MNGELRVGRSAASKRGNSDPYRSDLDVEFDRFPDDSCNRVFDFQSVPSSVPADPGPVKRPRPSSSSTAALRMKSSRASSRGSDVHRSSSDSRMKMAELLAIKRELTVIKVQIDGLLDCVDQMDRQRKDASDGPHSVRDPSSSPHQGSVCSLESPEPGEASEDEPLPPQHCCPYRHPPRIQQHQSDLEDDL